MVLSFLCCSVYYLDLVFYLRIFYGEWHTVLAYNEVTSDKLLRMTFLPNTPVCSRTASRRESYAQEWQQTELRPREHFITLQATTGIGTVGENERTVILDLLANFPDFPPTSDS